MNTAAQHTQPDTEVAELVERFERIYASLAPEELEADVAPVTTSAFSQDDFELPRGADVRTEPTGSENRVDAIASEAARHGRIEPLLKERDEAAQHGRVEADADELDIEDAFALLRGSENSLRSPVAARAADSDGDADAESEAHAGFERGRAERNGARALQPHPPRSYRRFAVPALAAMLFLGVATGYIVIRQNDGSSAQSARSTVPSTPLRLDYQLQQQAQSDALVARRTR